MRYKRRMRLPAANAITVAALLILGFATACGSSSTKSTTTASGTPKSTTTASTENIDPKTMVLQLQDLPTGFQTAPGSGYKSLTAAAKESSNVSAAQYKVWGYVTGFDGDFSKNGSVADLMSGAGEILSSVSVYRTSAGSANSLASTVKACSRPPFHELSLGVRIGDEAHLCTAVQTSGGVKAQVYAIAWRRGRIRASILVSGLEGSTSPNEAVALAKRQDSRIRQRF